MNLAILLNDWWICQLVILQADTCPLRHARKLLRDRGWTYRAAAAECGVCYQHLSEVLNGHRKSRSLLARIQTLPKRKEAA